MSAAKKTLFFCLKMPLSSKKLVCVFVVVVFCSFGFFWFFSFFAQVKKIYWETWKYFLVYIQLVEAGLQHKTCALGR